MSLFIEMLSRLLAQENLPWKSRIKSIIRKVELATKSKT